MRAGRECPCRGWRERGERRRGREPEGPRAPARRPPDGTPAGPSDADPRAIHAPPAPTRPTGAGLEPRRCPGRVPGAAPHDDGSCRCAPAGPDLLRGHVRLRGARQARGSGLLRPDQPGLHRGPAGGLRPGLAARPAGPALRGLRHADRPADRAGRDRHRAGGPDRPRLPARRIRGRGAVAGLLADRVLGHAPLLLRRRSPLRVRLAGPGPGRTRRAARRGTPHRGRQCAGQ